MYVMCMLGTYIDDMIHIQILMIHEDFFSTYVGIQDFHLYVALDPEISASDLLQQDLITEAPCSNMILM